MACGKNEAVPWVHLLVVCTEVLIESCRNINKFKVGVPVGHDSHAPLTFHWIQALTDSTAASLLTSYSRKRRCSEPCENSSAPLTSRSRLSLETQSLSLAIKKESLLQNESAIFTVNCLK